MASVPIIPDSYNHVLAEFECLDPLLSALRLDSSRLKCTCIAVSKRWLALGSSGGGLNLIQKDGWKQRLFLAHKEGAISRVACCLHDEDYVAVATSQGLVVVWELNQERRGKPERIYVSSEHKGRKVTALCWDTAALRVFVGDHVGKVSAIKINTSKQGKAAATFVMFPVQIITTVDSRVVQLDYLDGRLLISSLTRTYLCDTEREKFWKIGNKERDGEFGACFFPVGKNSVNQQPLIYCARPGSRMWEVNFDGEVQSTHQFKQLLSSSPLPVVTLRLDPHYTSSSCSPQSLSFPKLLYLAEHCVMTWTERGIYIFLPQSVQVLLWSEVKDIQDVAVYKSELFCLHTNGKVVHLSLLLVDRCIERLIRRGFWTLAARVCCLFQNSIISCRARKNLPLDKLEHLKSQLDASTQQDLITQMEELISKLEPLDSACSSRRSSISSHESFSILDSGIYRVISRRGSQSDEDSCSLHSQTFSEDERLKEFPAHQEDEQVELELTCHSPVALAMENEDMLKILKQLHDLGPWDDSPLLLVHAQRLYEKFGETALRPLIKFHPSILPSDIKQLCRNDPAHFLAYLDSLVKSKPEDKRSSLLRSLLQPESVRLDWLCLAVSHDAPQRANTVDAEGNPRPRSHLFTWGYSQLILLLIKLPADFVTKEKMADICKAHGFWPGYLFLCLELDRRIEAFTNIAHLDDLSLLNGEDGFIPETIEEWKFLLRLAQNHSTTFHHHGPQNGKVVSNGSPSCPDCITVENVALLLAKAIGPNRALPLLQECGLTLELSERFTGVCEILRIAEKRQRALIQSMLERCDRFLWSQQA
ncbi:BLOC-2 complex member HPS5 isoform X5 [Rissa tridactyla]|uniref:BLOC-2 complex member HPS5 isoform X5 n=1 Tax=Rissa tridactyla TaxID=75485 RepID=UPI0023BAB1D6|nr:BLOC-2 complex member HPS5 isoform X5 [Rissa tridactyla]